VTDDSIWKKEISLGRKKRPDAGDGDWEHESSEGGGLFRKRKRGNAPAPVEAEVEVPVEGAAPVPWWKREVSLGKRDPATVAEPAAGDEVPFWKREVGFGKKPQEAQAPKPVDPTVYDEPLKAAEAAAAALLADPNAEIEIFFQAPRRGDGTEVEDGSSTHTPAPDPPAFSPAPAAAAAAAFASAAAPTPATPPPPAPTPAAASGAGDLGPLPEPPPLQLEPQAAASTDPTVPTLPTLPTGPARPIPGVNPSPPKPATPPPPPPASSGIRPPVPAAELPSVQAPVAAAAAAPPKVPFWKKEIGGKKKAPKAAAAVAASAAVAPTASSAKSESTSFLRKKIEIGRRPAKTSSGDEPTSIWKKEISFSRKPKEDDELVAGSAIAGATVAATAVAESEKKVPFWKKEIGGKKKDGSEAAAPDKPKTKAEKGAKGASTPFWKKELSFKKSDKPKDGAKTKSNIGKAEAAARAQAHARSKRVIGLKVGASQIAAARVTNNGVAELVQVARQPLEQGIVVSGELRDPEALALQLKSFFAKNKLPKKGVRLGIASNRIGVRTFDVVGIEDEQQLSNAIQFRAQEALPIPLDEAVLDYHVLSEGVDAEGQPTKRVLLVVAYRELIDRYVSACRKAGIQLQGIDLEAFALLRALAPPRPVDQAPSAALVGVAIGHDRSTFAVSDGRVCEFTRVLEWGGAALNVAMARALDLAPSEVEGFKRSLELDGQAPVPEGLTPEQWATALDAVRRQLQSFARELVSSLQFYQNQPGSLGIGEIVLVGGTAQMQGLAEELQRLIGVPVRVGDPLARVKAAKKVAAADQLGSLAVAIGLGIED
jgi:type IV pilus assembly protein PilM